MKRLVMVLTALLPLFLIAGGATAEVWEVSVMDNVFQPDSLTVSVGDSVTWVNDGNRPHTSTSGEGCVPDGTWDSGTLQPGQRWGVAFHQLGERPYFCSFHCLAGMEGVIVVRNQVPTYAETWGKIKALYR